ncbi:KIN2 [[Candida] subhashii]|uniref:non-specific serine/threonine protein kinase n=1 Tax=[Candida] subhashii TaxID=561895 RepID=A0A8J5QKD6_9ASCO|nr:KIN2 [[Candida] subhashii]KAG7662048.1 KIN2 [[Candida] subhashii]
MDAHDYELQYQSRRAAGPPPSVQPPIVPPSATTTNASGRPATPRMLRSVSGSVKSKSELTPINPMPQQQYQQDPQQMDYVMSTSGNTSHKSQPSYHQNEIDYNSGSNSSNSHNKSSRHHKVQAPVAQRQGELLPPASIPSPEVKQSSNMPIQPAPTPAGMDPSGKTSQSHSSQQQQQPPPPPQQQQQGHSTQPQDQRSSHHHGHHNHGNAHLPQQQFHRKSIGDWDFIKTIGAGSMGKVKLAQHNKTKEICAVKIIPRAAKLYQRAHANDPPPQTTQEAAQRHKEFEKEIARDRRTIREGALGRLLFHPYICRLYEMVPMTNHYYMLFEHIEGGQMLDYIVAHGSLKERHARKFARGIASALDYCHKNNVVHRDLKIENIMINEKGDIKIIDFGLSNLYSPKSLLKTYCGSLYFAAPELLSAKPYTGPEVDVWSFGVVLYVLVCGKVPFDDQSVSVLHEKIKRGNVEYPNFLSRECVSLLSRMLVVDPLKRATLFEVCSHPWMYKGYEYKVASYVPKRVPLKLPLDPDIIKTIAAFDLGTVENITEELTSVLTSVEYQMSCENWYKITEQGREYASASNSHILPDPTGGFHPLVSVYYLADEMRKRKKAKEEAIRQQLMQQQQVQQQQQQQQQQLMQTQQAPLPPVPSQQQQMFQTPRQVPVPQQQQSQQPSQAVSAALTHKGREPSTPNQRIDDFSGAEIATQVAVLAQIAPGRGEPNTPTPRLVETFSPISEQPPAPTLDPASSTQKQQQQPTQLSVPEQAHTLSTFNKPSRAQPIETVTIDQSMIPEQQHQSPRESLQSDHMEISKSTNSPTSSGGLNSLFRRLSSKKSKISSPKRTTSPPVVITFEDNKQSTVSPQSSIKRDPLVRRGVSMKVTAKERSASERPAMNKVSDVRKPETRKPTISPTSKPHGFIPVEYLPPLPNIDANTNTIIPDKSTATAAMTTTATPQSEKTTTLQVPGARKMHPTARAKSVGGQVGKDLYVNTRAKLHQQQQHLPQLPSQNSEELEQKDDTDGFFGDIKLEDVEFKEVPQLTEEQVMAEYNNAKPNSMPSIEHCKTLFLKGFFSVQTTSAKPLPVIRYNIISTLSKLGVRFQEVKGGFVCLHTPSVKTKAEDSGSGHSTILDHYVDEESPTQPQLQQQQEEDMNPEEKKLYGDAFKSSSSFEENGEKTPDTTTSPDTTKTPSRKPSIHIQTQGMSPAPSTVRSHRSSNSIGSAHGHRRKFSIGNTFLGTYRKRNGSQVNMPPNTPAAAKVLRGMYDDDADHVGDDEEFEISDAFQYDDSADSLNGYIGGSDMLVSSKIEQRARHNRSTSISSQGGGPSAAGAGAKVRSPLKFEIHIVKVPLVGLYGVQFKKLYGNTWNYKTLASQVLNEMNL